MKKKFITDLKFGYKARLLNNNVKRFWIFIFLVCIINNEMIAATITSNNVAGDWDNPATWIGGNIPGSGDDVILNANARITVTADASCASLTWTGTVGATRRLTIDPGVTLTITGNIELGAPNGNNRNRMVIVEGTLFCNDFIMSTTSGNGHDIILDIATGGIANIQGNLIMPGNFARNHIDLSSGAILNIGGNVGSDASATTGGGGFTAPPSDAVINFNGSSDQFFFPGNSVTYGIIKVNNTSGLYLKKNTTVLTLTIGDEAGNSIFCDDGFNLVSTGTLNLLNGSIFRLGKASDNSTFPSFSTFNIEEGTTMHFVCESVNQAVSTNPQYANLMLSGGASKNIAGGTLTVRNKLTIDAGVTFNGNANDPLIVLQGDFENNGTFTSGTSLCSFEGDADQLITGTSSPLFNGGLTIANSGSPGNNTVKLEINITVNNALTISDGVFDLDTYTADRSSSGGTLEIANGSTLIIGGANTLPANYVTHSIGETSTVEYRGNNSVVASLNSSQSYGNLIFSGTGVNTTNSFSVNGEILVTGSFIAGAGLVTMNNAAASITNNGDLTFNDLLIAATPSNQTQYNASYEVNGSFEVAASVTFSPSGGTVTMTGDAGQIINSGGSIVFNDLNITGTISTSGDLSVDGAMIVNGSFNPAATTVIGGVGTISGDGVIYVTRINNIAGFSGQYTLNDNLIQLTTIYNGAGDQTITGENYGTLVVTDNGTRTVTLIANETIGVANTFTPDNVNTVYVVTNNTFNYNGDISQIITGFTYNNLIVSGNGDKTIPTGVVVNCSGLDIQTDIQLNIEGTAELNFL